ncbi:MAG: beta-ketoacyl-ACP synthase II [Alphaproteobacteria bacterium]|nr:beta-ketoacyl-ACP synthase II [Alphaproteobacteria bacterium]
MRRVVITGLGVVSPLGLGGEHVWRRLLAGDSGIVALSEPLDAFPCKVGGQVPLGATKDDDYDPQDWLSAKVLRQVEPFIAYGMVAARQAVRDSGWRPEEQEKLERTGVYIGSGVGGLEAIGDNDHILRARGPGKVSPFFMPGVLINLLAGRVSMEHGFMGPNSSVVTACSTGTHAIGDAARIIALDDADVMVAGGAEAALCPLGIEAFCALRALSTKFNDAPTRASRPWDTARDGFVMGEGAGIVVLEEIDHARARGADIYAEVVGYGMSGDAHHITAPHESGHGARLAMRACLRRAGVGAGDIDYVNAHATSTSLGDVIEARALRDIFGADIGRVSISSTKSQVGHLLGAAGALEAIFTVLALRDQVAPATLNLDDPAPETEGLDLVPHTPKERTIRCALSNSFGFGGTNASLLFRRIE